MTKSLREVIKEAGLSRKQAAIFRLYIDGKPTSFICRAVSISERTIGSYLSEIVGRLGFKGIGCEMSPEYLEIARRRIEHAQKEITQSELPLEGA